MTSASRPRAVSRPVTAAMVASSVRGPRMTSTILIRYDGFMKCTPTSSPGRTTQSAISSMGMQEVLEISVVPGRTTADTPARTLALVSGTSVTASMTVVASAASSSDVLVVSVPCGRPGGSTPIS